MLGGNHRLSLDSLTRVLQKMVWDDGHVHTLMSKICAGYASDAHVDENQLEKKTLIECIQHGSITRGIWDTLQGPLMKEVLFREALAS